MNHLQNTVFTLLICLGNFFGQAQLNIIPYPNDVVWSSGYFDLDNGVFLYSNSRNTFIDDSYRKFLSQGHVISQGVDSYKSGIRIHIQPGSHTSPEAYTLEITTQLIDITTPSSIGAFYALQTLKQIILPNHRIPCVKIEDTPRYSWRGSMVDMARSFIGLPYLYEHINRMAFYKLNRLHLHLSDDQGWRLESFLYPKLTTESNVSAVQGGQTGFITQQQYQVLQQYALERGIVIIPEIDMPGHLFAALKAYPELLNCTDNSNINQAVHSPRELYMGTAVGWNKLCLSDPEAIQVMKNLLEELAQITLGSYIHFGGDEVEDALYDEFVVEIAKHIISLGHTPVGWEDVLVKNIPDQVIGQVWNGEQYREQTNPIIYSMCNQFYLDHAQFPGQTNTNNWCKDSGVSIKDVFQKLPDNEHLIGVEAPIWTEYIHDTERMDSMLWPRLCAVAELGWTREINAQDFFSRIPAHETHWKALKINYLQVNQPNTK